MAESITAIIPTFNRRRYLHQAVESVLRQTRPVQEVVIWDDGSTDGTEQDVHKIVADEGGLVAFHRSENGGKSRALNRALEHAKGDIIWICDDDDVALPHAVETLEALLTTPNVGMAAGRHERFADRPDEKRVMLGTGYWPDLRTGSVLRHLLEDIFFFQNGCLIRRAALEKAGPFREDLARSIDYDMFVRLAVRSPVSVTEDIVFYQRKHDGARGPAAAQHTASQADAVWRDYDRRVFSDLRPILPISIYEAFFESTSEPRTRRAAYLQRGAVYARHCDWSAALEDFEKAANILPEVPLDTLEIDIVKRALAGKHDIDGIFARTAAESLQLLRAQGTVGTMIVSSIARGSRWRIRESVRRKDFAKAFKLVRLLLDAPKTSLSMVGGQVVSERILLPDEFYMR